MKRFSVALISGAVVLAAGALVVTTNPVANAGEGQDASARPDLAPAYLAAMRRDLGLSADQVYARLATEAKAADTASKLSESLGDDFAGDWIDRAGNLMVAVTDEDRAELVRAAGAEPKVVRYSQNELDQAKNSLDAQQAPATVHRWFADPVTNTVVVEVQQGADDAATKAWLDNAAAASPAMRVVEKAQAPQARANILGGQEWGADGAFCSVGFAATGAGGDKAFLTAGHCATEQPNDLVTNANGTRIGQYDSGTDVIGRAGDFAKVDVDANDTLVGAVDLFDGDAQPINGSAAAQIGAQICRSGAASGPDFGAPCGVITEKNVTVNTDFGGDIGVIAVSGMTGTDVCSDSGDSGGAYFSGDQAQGLLSSGVGFCGDAVTTSHFTPINRVLNTFDLDLVTDN